ncbi:DUF3037 domain-containing protein [Ramlibacter montanisoli]|uniref:DUF3037 domain-containing protein n=1 Tax=Ramlibacter montanisoli TaxID=2732512 RepID=A0A849K594_9BURK|nr:DUF3037 domain-containing protein [Ramlibacter montanisoli]NNU43582.1 DUF3037 domain-containing protein [Ramlibacter montanisoli]
MNSWLDLLKTPPSARLEPAGVIFVIRCTPDIFTGEQINVGVCAVDPKGRRKAKVVTEPARLQCLYGEQSVNVLMLAQAALEAAERGAPSPSAQIVFDDPAPYFNSTLDQAVENTFADQVTVALPHRDPAMREELPDDVAQTRVANAVKDQIGLDFELLANTPAGDCEYRPWPTHHGDPASAAEWCRNDQERLLQREHTAHPPDGQRVGLGMCGAVPSEARPRVVRPPPSQQEPQGPARNRRRD